ncbi:MAG: AAA family ATPase [Oligoflexia bacterium]|nr:AAA family ATPase [Oligoflexia bacterium]
MIETFYNLKKLPFQKDINSNNIFMASFTKELLRRFDYMKQNRGIMLITGLPGVGKTLYIRAFTDKLNQNMYKTFYTPLSTVNTLEFYRQLAFYLCGESLWKKSQLFRAIQDSIKDYVSNNKKIPVVIFDDSHLMKIENFYELQIIANFNMDSTDPCLFIVVGQAHLRDRLLIPVLQSFNQRISLKFYVPPFTKDETSSYIKHHLTLVGRTDPLFNDNAILSIFQISGGAARIINSLALKSMTIGAIEKNETISEEQVYRASQEL